MKIYTRTGDQGETGLLGGGRVPKAHLRVEAYGSVDELNAALGMALVEMRDKEVGTRLLQVQRDLFSLGASLARSEVMTGARGPASPPLPQERIPEMEAWIDAATVETPTLKSFILPGGTVGAAALHMARTVCRRAERAVVRLAAEETVDPSVLTYLNRLSDLLFALARLVNHRAGVADVVWDKGRR